MPKPIRTQKFMPELPSEALRHIHTLEKSDDPTEREKAARVLGEIKHPATANALANALADENTTVSAVASESLEKIGEPAIRTLEKKLNHEYDEVRFLALCALLRIDNPKTVKPILKALKDPVDQIRLMAAEALGEKKHVAAVKDLVALLDDRELEVSNASAQALRKIGLEMLRKEPKPNSGHPAFPFLQANPITHPGLFKRTYKENLKKKGDYAGEAHVKVIQKNFDVQEELKHLKHENHLERITALQRLSKEIKLETVNPIINVLKHDAEASVRESAAKALGEIAHEMALDALVESMKDKNLAVRQAASKAVQEIGFNLIRRNPKIPELHIARTFIIYNPVEQPKQFIDLYHLLKKKQEEKKHAEKKAKQDKKTT